MGGCLSDIQLVLNCADMNDFSGITGNPAKFGLGFVSIIFNVIFMVQYHCLYPEVSSQDIRSEVNRKNHYYLQLLYWIQMKVIQPSGNRRR
jgi:cystinosin